MALLDEVFSCIHSHRYCVPFALTPSMVDELWTWVVLAPLACSDLRESSLPEFVAVDASDQAIAVVSSTIGIELAREMPRHALRRPAWTRLLSPARAWERSKGLLLPSDELPDGVVYRSHPLWSAVAEHCPFHEQTCVRTRPGAHINVSELKGVPSLQAGYVVVECACLPLGHASR